MQQIVHPARILSLRVMMGPHPMKMVAVRARFIPIWANMDLIAVQPMAAIVSHQLNKKQKGAKDEREKIKQC